MKANSLVEDVSPFRRIGVRLLTIALWLSASVLALAAIFALRELVIWGAALLFGSINSLTRAQAAGLVDIVNNCGTMFLGLAAITAIIVGGEYSGKHLGERRLLRLLGVVIVVECAIVLPVGYFFWR